MSKDARVHLFHGDDAFAIAEARKKLEDAVLDPAWRDFNLTFLGPEASAGQAVSAVTTVPFGPGSRMVVVKDPPYLSGKSEDPGVADLEALLERGMPPNAHLLFLTPKADSRLKLIKAIAAKGAVREFGTAKEWQRAEQLGPWVEQLAQEHQRRIARDAVTALLEATNGDRYRIQREIEKLTVAAPAGATISVALVHELVAEGEGATFALTDALARRDAGAALVALGNRLVTQHPLQILAMIVTIMRGWAKIKGLQEQGLNAQQIAKEIKSNSDFKVRKDLEALRGWRAAQLEAALEALLEVDLAVKEGRWPPDAHRTLFERAITKMLG